MGGKWFFAHNFATAYHIFFLKKKKKKKKKTTIHIDQNMINNQNNMANTS